MALIASPTGRDKRYFAMPFSDLAALQRPRFPPPTWAEVVASVCALDGAERPLFALAPDCGPAEGLLTVQGRPGAYTLTAYLPGRGRFRYYELQHESP